MDSDAIVIWSLHAMKKALIEADVMQEVASAGPCQQFGGFIPQQTQVKGDMSTKYLLLYSDANL